VRCAHLTPPTPEHADVYWNLLCAVDPALLKLSGSRESDDTIYKDFKESFPGLTVVKFVEDDLKSDKAKVAWREFCERYKEMEDYNQGTLLRLDSGQEYSEANTTISVKIQFWAVEIARNREGHNSHVRKNFKPVPRGSFKKAEEEQVANSHVEAELMQVLSGQHPLLS